MKMENHKIKSKIINETFKDTRHIQYITTQQRNEIVEKLKETGNLTEDEIGDLFICENGEFINLRLHINDFDVEELSKRVELAENIYELYHKHISIYILCPKDSKILVRECVIKSEADFDIKLSVIPEDICEITLKFIKNKLNLTGEISEEDLNILSMLPVMCKKEERHYYRTEYFKINNNITY